MGPIVEFIQRHSSKGTSSSRERLDAAHETPQGDNLSGTPGVQTDAVGTRHPDESLQQKPRNGTKYKNKDHYFRPKGRLYSNDKTPYQRGKEETHKGVIARYGLLPMRMRHAQMTVTVSGGMRAN